MGAIVLPRILDKSLIAIAVMAVRITPVLGGLLLSTTDAHSVEPPITGIAFTRSGSEAVACSQLGLTVVSWPNLTVRHTVETSVTNPHSLMFSPSFGKLAVAGGRPSQQGMIQVFSWPELRSLQVLAGHEDSVMALAWRDEETLISGSLDHGIIVWDVVSGGQKRQLNGHARGVTSLTLLPDKSIVVSAGIDQSLRIWKLDSGVLQRSLSIHTQPVNALALRPSVAELPMIASASADKTVRLWQPTLGRMVRFVRLSAVPLDIDWLPDGSQIIAVCDDGVVRWIDPDTIEVTQETAALEGWIYSLRSHPTDGGLLIGGGNGQLRRLVPESAKPAQ